MVKQSRVLAYRAVVTVGRAPMRWAALLLLTLCFAALTVDPAGITPRARAAAPARTDIQGAPPTTTDDTDPGYVWFNHDVTVHFTATDPDSDLADTEYWLDNGAGWVVGTQVTISADAVTHSTDGEHMIFYRSRDTLGNLESDRECWVRIDTQGAATKPLARAGVRKGRTATLRYRVNEQPFPCGPTATVTINIKNHGGRVVKTLHLGLQTVNTDLKAIFKCKLKVGRYRFWIFAVDSALNKQAKIGKGYLRVR